MAFRKILCPVDFSEPSRAAMGAAVEQARATNGALTLLNVYHPPVLMVPEYPGSPIALAEIAKASEIAIRDWADDARRLGAASTEGVAIEGVPWDQIVMTATRQGFDLIVIGTHGRTGLKHALLGSVAEKVVRHAKCPVLVVR